MATPDGEDVTYEKERPPIMRGEVLDTARQLVTGPRAADYGDAREQFSLVGVQWAALLHAAGWDGPDGEGVPAHIVALMMAAFKGTRAAYNPHAEDSWVDGAGYFALGGELGVGS